jgi:hypothetical protein
MPDCDTTIASLDVGCCRRGDFEETGLIRLIPRYPNLGETTRVGSEKLREKLPEICHFSAAV